MVHLLLAVIYLAFISLGLPDSLLGAAWPVMCTDFSVPLSYAGIVSMIICAGTILSSLLCDRIVRRIGAAVLTAASVAMTAVALLGFSFSTAYWMLILWAVPYGIGAGCVDAALNNYVALHFASRHMNWLHSMWGVGASAGPYIMGFVLSRGQSWNVGYLIIAFIQFALTAVLLLSIPIWSRGVEIDADEKKNAHSAPVRLIEIVSVPGAWEILLAFFCYCALEQTAALWVSTYLTRRIGLHEDIAASLASLFYIGITVGRIASGFLSIKIHDKQMIRLSEAVLAVSFSVLFLPLGKVGALIGLSLFGLGCAPIYPAIIHSTPEHFGAERSQAMIGVQMASAYVGTLVMPPLFGLIANHVSVALLPLCLAILAALMAIMCERVNRKTAH